MRKISFFRQHNNFMRIYTFMARAARRSYAERLCIYIIYIFFDILQQFIQ